MSEHHYSQYGLLNSLVWRKQMRNGKMKTRTVAIVDYTAIDIQEDIMDQILWGWQWSYDGDHIKMVIMLWCYNDGDHVIML